MKPLRSIVCFSILTGILILSSPRQAAADNPITDIAKVLCWACWLSGGLVNPKVCWDPETGKTCRRIVFGDSVVSSTSDDFVAQMQSGIDLSEEEFTSELPPTQLQNSLERN